MDKTYLDEIIEYPNKVIREICSNKDCIAFLVNKHADTVNDDDIDTALDKYIYDYQYIDETTSESCAYICVEANVGDVSNKHIKTMDLYITVACSKDYMKLNNKTFPGISGNRRDNLVRYIDRLLNGSDIFGIGELTLSSVSAQESSNSKFTIRELVYEIPDFNRKERVDGVRIY